MTASWRLCAEAFCRTEQFEVSPPISGLTPWGHNKKKEQNANSLFDPVGEEGEDEEDDEE